ncbi:MAG: flagellar hook-length control protein FliK [Pirellulaceae bacterium]|nr:flagellar hook-length control protein FliK [Pirellulaceae bacterium]
MTTIPLNQTDQLANNKLQSATSSRGAIDPIEGSLFLQELQFSNELAYSPVEISPQERPPSHRPKEEPSPDERPYTENSHEDKADAATETEHDQGASSLDKRKDSNESDDQEETESIRDLLGITTEDRSQTTEDERNHGETILQDQLQKPEAIQEEINQVQEKVVTSEREGGEVVTEIQSLQEKASKNLAPNKVDKSLAEGLQKQQNSQIKDNVIDAELPTELKQPVDEKVKVNTERPEKTSPELAGQGIEIDAEGNKEAAGGNFSNEEIISGRKRVHETRELKKRKKEFVENLLYKPNHLQKPQGVETQLQSQIQQFFKSIKASVESTTNLGELMPQTEATSSQTEGSSIADVSARQIVDPVQAKGGDRPIDQGDTLSGRLAAQMLPKAKPRGPNGTTPQSNLNRTQQARFMQRVTNAFRAAASREGGEIRLRLSPPELGTMKLQIKIEGSQMAAKVEVETAAARVALTENLQILKERLSGQGIDIERFDVELSEEMTGEQQDRQEELARQQERQQQSRPQTNRSAQKVTDEKEGEEPKRQDHVSEISDTNLNVII